MMKRIILITAIAALSFQPNGNTEESTPDYYVTPTKRVISDRKREGVASNPGDVPVVTPKRRGGAAPSVKPKDIPVVFPPRDIADQDTLPIQLIKNKISSMPFNYTAYVSLKAIKADGNRKCWIHPYTLFGDKNANRPIQIRRDAFGYHITLENVSHKWMADDFDKTNWIPIITIKIQNQ